MTKPERQQLNELLSDLNEMRQYAPFKTTYSQGRVQASIATMLMDSIQKLQAILKEGDDATIPDTETEKASA
jgi:hypothetical protein